MIQIKCSLSFFLLNRLCIIKIQKSSRVPCDYFLFPKLKTDMKGASSDDIPVIQAAVTQVLKNIRLNDMK